jgi:YVTN family beta-propeller protein
VKVFRTNDFSLVATIPVGKLPHGVWPSGDGSRVYVGLENDDQLTAIDTLTNTVIANVPIGQAAQAIVYVPNAVPERAGTELGNAAMSVAGAGVPGEVRTAGLQPLGVAGQSAHFTMAPPGQTAAAGGEAPTTLSSCRPLGGRSRGRLRHP